MIFYLGSLPDSSSRRKHASQWDCNILEEVFKMQRKRPDYYKGMDISFLPEGMDNGWRVRDFDGTRMDPFDLIQKYGVNSIRLRIWNNPENVPESKGYCSLAYTIEMAKKIKAHGMSFVLDFHYSDYWADPAQQRKPKAWEGLNFEELKQAVYTYTRDTLFTLKKEGLLPDMVQIGNEIRSGLLFPDGELPDYGHMVQLINAGIMGAREVADADTMQVIIHLDQGGRYFYLKEWFQKAMKAGLADFDVIGLSYYPFWHGTFPEFRETLAKLVHDYGKPVMIVETAHAWRKTGHGFIDESQEKIAGIPATPAGQRKVLDLVNNIVASLPDRMGLGLYYWEPVCIPPKEGGGWADNMGLFNENGVVMEGIHAFEFTREQLRGKEPARVYEPLIRVRTGEDQSLPEKLTVLFYDGTTEKRKVCWQEEMPNRVPGTYQISGQAEGVLEPVSVTVEVTEQWDEEKNLVRDMNWEEGLTQWELEKSDDLISAQLYPEFVDPFPAPPINSFRFESERNFTLSLTQQIRITQEGSYSLSVLYKGTDTTNVDIRLFVESAEGIQNTVIHPMEHEWNLYEIRDLQLKPQVVTVGIRVMSPPVYGLVRSFRFIRS